MQQGSFRFPDNCPDADCDFLVTYQASGDNNVVFELRGKGNWAGVGFSGDDQMPDTDILICVSDISLSGHYYATGRRTPTRTNPTPSAVVISDQSFNNGVVSCRITREVNPGIQNFKDLDQQQFLLGAIGRLAGKNVPKKFTIRAQLMESFPIITHSQQRLNLHCFLFCFSGILMTLAWTLFAFVGLFTARYMRQVWEPRKLLGEKAWFTVHRTLMTVTLLLTIASTIFIFVKEDGWSDDKGAHPFCGMVAITFAVIQPIMAAFRPHPGEPRRNIFNWTHRIVGFIALIMAVVTIYLGLCLYNEDVGRRGLYAVIAFYVGELCVLLFEVYLILSKRSKEKRTSQVNNGGHDSNPDVPFCHPCWSKCVADHNPTSGVKLNKTKVSVSDVRK
ncbi:unnamed protein product [Porites evermanni]|uniref:Ferric-chelate reductase 1 n=1 Tax=Porites evermanni TaxID=104178 RepID=A0ABN8M9W3_9CNID|nr:unnamed protein product [Porites evermanni]